MKLTDEELEQYRNDGYLFLPGRFSLAEAAVLREEADRLYATDRQEVWRESSGAPRTAFAAHLWSEPFRRLGRHPRQGQVEGLEIHLVLGDAAAQIAVGEGAARIDADVVFGQLP